MKKKWTIQFYNGTGDPGDEFSDEYIVKGDKLGHFRSHICCDGWFIANYLEDIDRWELVKNVHHTLELIFNDADLAKTWDGFHILGIEDYYWDTDYDYLDDADDVEKT